MAFDSFATSTTHSPPSSCTLMMMEDAKIYNKGIYIMYADFKGAINAADHRTMFKQMRQLGMFLRSLTHVSNSMESLPPITTPPYGRTPFIVTRGGRVSP
jgi:hypothetical protein